LKAIKKAKQQVKTRIKFSTSCLKKTRWLASQYRDYPVEKAGSGLLRQIQKDKKCKEECVYTIKEKRKDNAQNV